MVNNLRIRLTFVTTIRKKLMYYYKTFHLSVHGFLAGLSNELLAGVVAGGLTLLILIGLLLLAAIFKR